MNFRRNFLKAVRFERPDHIIMRFGLIGASYFSYPQDFLFDMMESHKLLFPDFKRPESFYVPEIPLNARKASPYTDDWGCVWETTEDGITGQVHQHPLADWSAFENYKAPDPALCTGVGPIDWDGEKTGLAKAKENGELTWGKLRHGFSFLQLCDLRGYENVVFDMADGDERFMKLMDMIDEFNLSIVDRYLETGVDIMDYPEDLGLQNGPLITPQHFRKYIKPGYQRIMQPARKKGAIVHMHSDGHLHDLIDDILDSGVDVINLQDLVNGIDWIAERLAGKVCIALDVDRQNITFYGTPGQIDALIREEVEKIGRKEGGLLMNYGLYPGVPLENIKAVMDAMEKYAAYYS